MNITIYYNSKTGFTKKYADWIAEELKCNVLSYKKYFKKSIKDNNLIIFGSRVHAGKIESLNKVKTCFSGKNNLIVFVTGATPSFETEVIEKMWKNNFTNDEIDAIPHFYMQSGLDYSKMGIIDRIVMKIVASIIGKKKNKNKSEEGFEQAIKKSHDISSIENITPLLKYIRDKYKIE